MLRAESAGTFPESFADRINSTFALDRFKDNRADGIVEFSFEIRDIVELHEFHPGNERSKWRAVFFRGGNAERAEGAPVKRICHGQEARLGGTVGGNAFLGQATKARELQSAIDRFGATVGEEHAIEAGPLDKFACERTLKFVVKQI